MANQKAPAEKQSSSHGFSPTLPSLLHELVLQLINHGPGTMELRLDPLSSSFNPYFSVIIGKKNKARVMLTWPSQQVSFQ